MTQEWALLRSGEFNKVKGQPLAEVCEERVEVPGTHQPDIYLRSAL
jgi:hypothetical protein